MFWLQPLFFEKKNLRKDCPKQEQLNRPHISLISYGIIWHYVDIKYNLQYTYTL